MVVNTEVQTGSCIRYNILGDYWLIFSYILSGYLRVIINTECLQYFIYLDYHISQTKKQNIVMKTYKELLGTCIKSKKTVYLKTVCTKSASKDYLNCLAIFGSSACQGQHAFSMSVLTCTAPWSSHTNVQELIETL